MTAQEHFACAATLEAWGGRIFRGVFVLSALALMLPEPIVKGFINPGLIGICFLGVLIAYFTAAKQNEGNHLLRATQLTDGFHVPVGALATKGYYNNQFPPSMDRLAVTTFENSFFSSSILHEMLKKERFIIAIYVVLFLVLMGSGRTSTNALVLFAQTLFSADVVLHWLRMERFHDRVCRVHRDLRQFFVQGGTGGDNQGVAILIGAFADYESAKDEAAMPLDSEIFKKQNARLSKEWDQLRKDIKIP